MFSQNKECIRVVASSSDREAAVVFTLKLIEFDKAIKGSASTSFEPFSLSGKSLSYVPGHKSEHRRISLKVDVIPGVSE